LRLDLVLVARLCSLLTALTAFLKSILTHTRVWKVRFTYWFWGGGVYRARV
jgi:hypothetical protein